MDETEMDQSEREVELPSPSRCIPEEIEITGANIGLLDEVLRVVDVIRVERRLSVTEDVNGFYSKCRRYWQNYLGRKLKKKSAFSINTFFLSNYPFGLMELLRQSVLFHRWTDTLKIVNALVKDGDVMIDTIWKAGTMALVVEKKSKFVRLFLRQVQRVSDCRLDVLFDHLLYLLYESDFEDIKDLQFRINKIKFSEDPNEQYMKALFTAYLGLIDYVQWSKNVTECDVKDETDIIMICSQVSQELSAHADKETAIRAIEKMSSIKDIPGVWDIFIVKIVEIHEFYEAIDDARLVLEEYKRLNPDNPNAHRYHLEFEKKHGERRDQALLSMKNIVRLDPSNPMALKLYEELASSDPDAVSILFNYLDFDHCKDDLNAWILLWKHLHEGIGNEGAVTTCWTSRKDWWPWSTLQTSPAEHGQSDSLSTIKHRVHKRLKKCLKRSSGHLDKVSKVEDTEHEKRLKKC